MADPHFFNRKGPFSLSQLASELGVTLGPGADPDMQVYDMAPLDSATAKDLSFVDNPKYLGAFAQTAAGACLAAPKFADRAPAGTALLLSDEPYRAYARAAQIFYPVTPEGSFGEAGIHPDATVHPTAKLAEDVTVEPGARIGAMVEIGSGTVIGMNAGVAKGCKIGRQCFIGPGVTLTHTFIGDRVILHPGVRIGQDGFGFAMGLSHLKIPQLGRVIIQDEVEIGANSTIDRGAGPDTIIGAGTKIDNLVQIGHNVTTGEHCVIVALSGVSGSAVLEDYVILAAQSGVTGHVTVGAGAQLAARGAIVKDVPPGARLGGAPAKPVGEWKRELIAVNNLVKRKKKDD